MTSLKECVGKTVARVEEDISAENAYQVIQQVVTLHFTDGSHWAFVIASDEDGQ